MIQYAYEDTTEESLEYLDQQRYFNQLPGEAEVDGYIHTMTFLTESDMLTETQMHIIDVCKEVTQMLIEKNRKYGDSAVNPIGVFSKAPAVELINIRIDDKLSRKRSDQNDEDEDIDLDLMGYLILKRVAQRLAR